jgi:hypothetical protein
MTVVKVAVGSPWSFVANEVEYDSHEGSSWVGAVMQGGRNGRRCQGGKGLEEGAGQSRWSAGIGAVAVRCEVMGAEGTWIAAARNVKMKRWNDREQVVKGDEGQCWAEVRK